MIEFGWLWFLAEPWFVLPFYGIGLLGAGWVIGTPTTSTPR